MFYLVKAPRLLQLLYPDCLWKVQTEEMKAYLTFDDGPHPEITPYVLEQLALFQAKATFFCIGEQVEKHPDIYQQIIDAGHRTGNHTYSHLNGWKTSDEKYFKDVEKAATVIKSNLFRPPYGRIRRFQLKIITGERLGLKPVMWHVLSGDFDTSLKPEQCYLNVVKNTSPGSIIVFHDSEKAFPRLKDTLPKALKYLKDKGFSFDILD
ncbi:MAG: polysaccharide deacetylase family protein [Chitinophagaceae bacterium]|nr:polysaccharide deacetylase family protein [Chitinophagaceae bacterium]MCZ2395861.1 polysaccharide deacetylase family protein [Chitinophagales bacterium]